jgi:HSP20 family molecular chaperone IbpA
VDGYRAPDEVGPEAVYYTLQIRRGRFQLEVPLPAPVDIDRPEVNFGGGILQLSLPKRSNGAEAAGE